MLGTEFVIYTDTEEPTALNKLISSGHENLAQADRAMRSWHELHGHPGQRYQICQYKWEHTRLVHSTIILS